MTSVLVGSERRGDVALLTLANPPVNSLGVEARKALWQALVAADEDSAVRAIVLTGADRGFCAGGDLGATVTVDGSKRDEPGGWDHFR